MSQAGCQINLDLGEGQISRCVLVDDFRLPCSEIDIGFESPTKLTFTPDNQCYFTYKSTNWVPCSFREGMGKHNTYHYEIRAYPRPYFDFVNSPTTDTNSLAKQMGLTLAEDSQSLPIKCPIVGLPASMLINEYRSQSLQEGYRKKDMGKAHFIYFNSKHLLSVTFSKLINQTAKTLTIPSFLVNSTVSDYVDERIDSYLRCYKRAGAWKSDDYVYKLFGRKFEIKETVPAAFLRMYTMKFDDTNEFDTDTSYLCIRTEWNVMQPNGYLHTFAEVNHVR